MSETLTLPDVPPHCREALAIATDGLDRPLDMVLSAKLADLQTTATAPYWKKKRGNDRNRTSEVAELRHKSSSLSKDMQNLLKLHERQEAVVADLRTKLKETRGTLAAKERALDLAHRTIERLSVGKNTLESSQAASKTYIRQLEARVGANSNLKQLQEQCAQFQSKAAHAHQEAEVAREEASALHEALHRAELETDLLRRGLHLAAEQLTRSNGMDVGAELFQTAARAQREAEAMARKLADGQDQLDEMAVALTAARKHLQAQHSALLQWTDWERDQNERMRTLEEELQGEKTSVEALKSEMDDLRQETCIARRKAHEALRQLEIERTAREEGDRLIAALRQALQEREASVEQQPRMRLQRALSTTEKQATEAIDFHPANDTFDDPAGPRPFSKQAKRREQENVPRDSAPADSRRAQSSETGPRPAPAPRTIASKENGDGRRARSTPNALTDDTMILEMERELAQLAPRVLQTRQEQLREPQQSHRHVPSTSISARDSEAVSIMGAAAENAQPTPSSEQPQLHVHEQVDEPMSKDGAEKAAATISASFWRDNPLADERYDDINNNTSSGMSNNERRAAAPRSQPHGKHSGADRGLNRECTTTTTTTSSGAQPSLLSGASGLSEEAIWNLLQRRWDTLQGEDARLMALWQNRANQGLEDGLARNGVDLLMRSISDSAGTAFSSLQANTVSAMAIPPRPSSSAQQDNLQQDAREAQPIREEADIETASNAAAPVPDHGALRVVVPEAGAGGTAAMMSSGPLPEIGSSKLLAPAMENATCSVEWLRGSTEQDIRELEATATAMPLRDRNRKDFRPGGGENVEDPSKAAAAAAAKSRMPMHADDEDARGIDGGAQVRMQPDSRPVVRHTLFDLARMDLELL